MLSSIAPYFVPCNICAVLATQAPSCGAPSDWSLKADLYLTEPLLFYKLICIQGFSFNYSRIFFQGLGKRGFRLETDKTLNLLSRI